MHRGLKASCLVCVFHKVKPYNHIACNHFLIERHIVIAIVNQASYDLLHYVQRFQPLQARTTSYLYLIIWGYYYHQV